MGVLLRSAGAIRRARGRQPGPVKHREDGFRLGSWVNVQRTLFQTGELSPERQARLTRLPWSWDALRAAWEERFAALQRFVEREGHARVPYAYTGEEAYLLGVWVSKQRASYREGTLDPEYCARLMALPGWVWELGEAAWEAAWEEGFAYLDRFVTREDHSLVPVRWREDDYRLGEWVAVQRRAFNQGKLAPERRAKLEGHPGWTWRPDEAAWEKGFGHLQRFVEREGHARVPAQWRESGFRLGSWVGTQRGTHRQGTLDPVRRARLEAVPGWAWNRNEFAWQEGFSRLERFVEREGHSRVTLGTREDGYSLGRWVSKQRQAYRNGTLDPERIARLEALRGWAWEVRKARRA